MVIVAENITALARLAIIVMIIITKMIEIISPSDIVHKIATPVQLFQGPFLSCLIQRKLKYEGRYNEDYLLLPVFVCYKWRSLLLPFAR